MLLINNIPILVNVRDVIYDLKLDLLSKGISQFNDVKYSSSNLMTSCIFHADRHPSFGILLKEKISKKGVKLKEGDYHCFSCGKTGNLQQLVSHCFGYDDDGKFGSTWLLDRYNNFELDNRENTFKVPTREQPAVKETIKYVSEEELSKYRFYHDYMYSRGLTDDIINKFDIGYQRDAKLSEEGMPFEAVTFPVRLPDGNCLFVAKRAIKHKLFYLPKDLDKPIYGLYELQYMFPNAKELYICESIFNALTLISFGLPAVALFGTSTDTQIEILKSLPYRVMYLCLDNDKAGRNGIKRLTNGLKYDKIVYTVETPSDGTDINNHWQDGLEWFNSLPRYIT